MTKRAVVAGGCFWGLEALLRTLPGVISTTVGYTGGENDHPTYQYHPGHAEAVEVEYDPSVLSYRELLSYFFRIHDPTTKDRQGGDLGRSYRSAVFYASPEEHHEATSFIEYVDRSGVWPDPVVTTLEPLTTFWPAEEEHQDYLEKHPGGYTCHQVYFDQYE